MALCCILNDDDLSIEQGEYGDQEKVCYVEKVLFEGTWFLGLPSYFMQYPLGPRTLTLILLDNELPHQITACLGVLF